MPRGLLDRSQARILGALMSAPGSRRFTTILVIDDEDTVRAMVTELLEQAGHIVFGAASGAEGLTVLQVVLPDLILLDQFMPRMSGIEVVQRLRAEESTRRIPIVALTSAGAEEANALSRAGCVAFIPKPFDPDEFRRVVAGIVNATVERARRAES
jgi:CheY-like chemotaxis protein